MSAIRASQINVPVAEKIEFLRGRDTTLRSKERNFVNDMAALIDRYQELTPKQHAWIDSIYHRALFIGDEK